MLGSTFSGVRGFYNSKILANGLFKPVWFFVGLEVLLENIYICKKALL